jgi:hypothetical protein
LDGGAPETQGGEIISPLWAFFQSGRYCHVFRAIVGRKRRVFISKLKTAELPKEKFLIDSIFLFREPFKGRWKATRIIFIKLTRKSHGF